MELPGDPLAPKIELGPRMGSSMRLASLSVPSTSAHRGAIPRLSDALPRPDPHLNVVIVSWMALAFELVFDAIVLFPCLLPCLAAPSLKENFLELIR